MYLIALNILFFGRASLATEYGWYEMIEKMFTTQASLDDLLQNNMYENITLETLYLKTAHERDDFIFRYANNSVKLFE